MRARLDPHSKYRELLAARLDRPLKRAESRLVVSHLKSCPECRQAERDYLDQRSLLRSMPRPLPPRDMWARTSTALDREVARWSYRYPRFGRPRVPLDDRPSRSGSPSALATAVAALGVVTVLAVLQLTPAIQPAPSTFAPAVADGSPLAPPRPTPIAVAPQPLVMMAAGLSDFAVYETQVNQVCPPTVFECFDDERIVKRRVSLAANIHPENVALSPSGEQVAMVGTDSNRDFIGVVMLGRAGPSDVIDPTSPERTPDKTGAAPATTAQAPSSPGDEPTRSSEPSDSMPATPRASHDPIVATPAATPNSGEPTPSDRPHATADAEGTPEPPPAATPTPTAIESPPASAVPGLRVLSILEDVHSAGSPPAWSRDGSMLAFSAMPADGRHGPDVYLWAPGDEQAHAITTDHASFFASWSGRRIVASRLDENPGKSDSLVVRTVVIDPTTLEERTVDGPQMWLPIVDSERSHAIAWHGKLDRQGKMPAVRSGALYVVDWAALNPFGEAANADATPAATDDADATAEPRDAAAPKLVPVDPTRDPVDDPVFDWHVRWSTDGRVVGVWVAEGPGATWGSLELLAFDQATGRLDLDDPLIDKEFARRGFTLGLNRVAWVAAPERGNEGELRIRTWGEDGEGQLLIRTLEVEELVPAF